MTWCVGPSQAGAPDEFVLLFLPALYLTCLLGMLVCIHAGMFMSMWCFRPEVRARCSMRRGWQRRQAWC